MLPLANETSRLRVNATTVSSLSTSLPRTWHRSLSLETFGHRVELFTRPTRIPVPTAYATLDVEAKEAMVKVDGKHIRFQDSRRAIELSGPLPEDTVIFAVQQWLRDGKPPTGIPLT